MPNYPLVIQVKKKGVSFGVIWGFDLCDMHTHNVVLRSHYTARLELLSSLGVKWNGKQVRRHRLLLVPFGPWIPQRDTHINLITYTSS